MFSPFGPVALGLFDVGIVVTLFCMNDPCHLSFLASFAYNFPY